MNTKSKSFSIYCSRFRLVDYEFGKQYNQINLAIKVFSDYILLADINGKVAFKKSTLNATVYRKSNA